MVEGAFVLMILDQGGESREFYFIYTIKMSPPNIMDYGLNGNWHKLHTLFSLNLKFTLVKLIFTA